MNTCVGGSSLVGTSDGKNLVRKDLARCSALEVGRSVLMLITI
jgi:hypothetical protein